MANLRVLNLWDWSCPEVLNIKDIAAFLEREGGGSFKVQLCGSPFVFLSGDAIQRVSEHLSKARIIDPFKMRQEGVPFYADITFHKSLIEESRNFPIGMLYDGISLIDLFSSISPFCEASDDVLDIIFTNQLFATWAGDRFHIRVAVFGYPTLISTSGLVEGPAKPRQYYLLSRQFQPFGGDAARVSIKQHFQGNFIEYNDPRTTEVLKGYALQALFFHLTGNPFCEDKSCRLYNAHWQEEIIHAQLEVGKLCPAHEAVLKGLRGEVRS